jgi:hypothetical protein
VWDRAAAVTEAASLRTQRRYRRKLTALVAELLAGRQAQVRRGSAGAAR